MSAALDQAAILASPQEDARAGRPRLAVEVARDWSLIEAEWRELERDGIGSPYQRFDWMRAYAESLPSPDEQPHPVLILRDEARRPLLLMPLAIEGGALRVASGLGGRHANFHMPLCPPGAAQRLAPEALRPALA